MVGWDEVDQWHPWVLELDWILASLPAYLWSWSIDLALPCLIFLIFKVELIGISGEINEIMHIKRLAVGMAHGKHLVIIGDHVPEIAVEVKPWAPGRDCKSLFKLFHFPDRSLAVWCLSHLTVFLTIFGTFKYLQGFTPIIQFEQQNNDVLSSNRKKKRCFHLLSTYYVPGIYFLF